MVQASFVILAHIAAAMLLAWLYFRRYAMSRIPIGVFNLADIAIMIGAVILVPFLYLLLPLWIVAGLLALASVSLLYFTWEPVLRSVWAVWLVTILLAGADLITALLLGIGPVWFFAVNNAVLVISVAGVLAGMHLAIRLKALYAFQECGNVARESMVVDLLPGIGPIKPCAELFHILEKVSHCPIALDERSAFIPKAINCILYDCHKSPPFIRQLAP